MELLYTLIDKQVMSKKEMSVAFVGNTPHKFNTFLQRAVKDGKNVKTFFPVGDALQMGKDRYYKLKEVYNKNLSLINKRE